MGVSGYLQCTYGREPQYETRIAILIYNHWEVVTKPSLVMIFVADTDI